MSHHEVEAWLRAGRPEDPSVEAHLATCAHCRRRVAEADEVRGWFLEPAGLDAETAAAMRFRLEAAARGAGSGASTRPRRRRRALLLVAALLSFGGLAFALSPLVLPPELEPAAPPPPSPAPRPAAPAPRPAPPPAPEPAPAPAPEVAAPADVDAPAEERWRTPVDDAFQQAWQHLNAGDPRRARRGFERLRRRRDLGARRPDVLFWLAESAYRAGDRAAARRHFARLLARHPGYHRAADAEARLASLLAPAD